MSRPTPLPEAELSSARPGRLSGLRRPVLVGILSLAFAAPHFHWALGGCAGMGAEAAVADVAHRRDWFAAYDLVAGCLAVMGAVVTLALARSRGGPQVRRWLLVATITASVVLLLRGTLGSALLAVDALQGRFDTRSPAILLAIEPWFLLGGCAYGAVTLTQRKPHPAGVVSP